MSPSILEGIEKYLGAGMVKGIGTNFAGKLIKACGERPKVYVPFFVMSALGEGASPPVAFEEYFGRGKGVHPKSC